MFLVHFHKYSAYTNNPVMSIKYVTTQVMKKKKNLLIEHLNLECLYFYILLKDFFFENSAFKPVS